MVLYVVRTFWTHTIIKKTRTTKKVFSNIFQIDRLHLENGIRFQLLRNIHKHKRLHASVLFAYLGFNISDEINTLLTNKDYSIIIKDLSIYGNLYPIAPNTPQRKSLFSLNLG